MSLAVIPLAITMNAGPQIMSAIIFVTAPKALKLSAYFLAGVVIAVTEASRSPTPSPTCSVAASRSATPRIPDRSAT